MASTNILRPQPPPVSRNDRALDTTARLEVGLSGGGPVAALTLPRRSGFRLIFFLLYLVVLTGPAAAYLYGFASDQYMAEFRFAIRRQASVHADGQSVAGAVGGSNPMLAVLQDSEMVVQYLKSRQAVDDVRTRIDIERVWSGEERDWLARMPPGAPAERQVRYWHGMVFPYLDLNSGIVTVQVWAFTPDDARALAEALQQQSETLVNQMSRRAQEDALTQARREVTDAEAGLRQTRVALATFRNDNAVLFPQLSASGLGEVETRMRASIADLRSQLTARQSQGGGADSLVVRVLQGRITSMEAEADRIQGQMSRPSGRTAGPSLATVLNGYSELEADEKMAQEWLERAQLLVINAHSDLMRQSVYLNAFVLPAAAQTSTYPVRWSLLLQAQGVLVVVWLLGAMALRALREHAA